MFGDLLRAHRRRLGLTQDELAAKSGVGVRSLRDLEAARITSPRQGTVRLLADALGLNDAERGALFRALAGDVDESPGPSRPRPDQLPPDVAGFAGRADHLERLTAAVDGAAPSAVVISAIAGTAGVGKTALAVHWAHRTADRFPDGRLFVNLRGFDPGGTVMDPAEAVRQLLDALGVAPERIPPSPEAQIGLYRSLLAGRRVLVVLDNARDSEQVRPLVAGAGGSLVLATSRNDLSGLVATDGAWPLTLDVLSVAESEELLARRLGRERVEAEPDAVETIISRCARLPLALAITAARAQRTGFALSALAAELANAGELDALDAGDSTTRLRSVFSWSYGALAPAPGRLFRWLGLHPGPDISATAAASLIARPVVEARRLLAELVRAHLLIEHRPNRYTFHDLLRAYATELVNANDPEEERRAALTRLLDHYTHTAHAADRLLNPGREPTQLPLAEPAPGTTLDHIADEQGATAWLTAEHAVLVAVIRHAVEAGYHTQAWQLAWEITVFTTRRSQWNVAIAAWQPALRAAENLGNLPAEARAHRLLAGACAQAGRLEDADRHVGDALELGRRIGDDVVLAGAHQVASFVRWRRGELERGLYHAGEALALLRAPGHERGAAYVLNNLGWLHVEVGDCAQALECCDEALSLLRTVGERHGQANVWDTIGYAHHHLGNHREAAGRYHRALEIYREFGDGKSEADTLSRLGDTLHAAGDAAAARDAWKQALEIFVGLDHHDADAVRAKLADDA